MSIIDSDQEILAMKPSVTTNFDERAQSVFDRSRFGFNVAAERHDEPGDEVITLQIGDVLADNMGDWSWKPRRRLVITGPLCTCSVHEPVGTNCARHDGTYKPPTKNPLRTVIILN